MKLSMIVPAYNEESNVRPFYEETVRVFSEARFTYEMIFVDDGSKDNTYVELQKLVADAREKQSHFSEITPVVKAVSFSRNFGKEAAMTAGLEAARGRAAGRPEARRGRAGVVHRR